MIRLAAAIVFGWTFSAMAGDLWVVRGSSGTAGPGCDGIRWVADVIVHNRTAAAAPVRALHVSNGGDFLPNGASLPAHTSSTVSALGVGGGANAGLWVTSAFRHRPWRSDSQAQRSGL